MLSLYSSQGLNEMAGLWTISNYYDGFPSYVHNSLDLFLFFDAATWAWKVCDTLGGVNAFAYLPMTNLGYIPLGSEAAEFFPWRVVSEVNSLTWVTDATMTATCLNETLFVDPCYIMSCGEDTDTCLDPSNNCTYCSDSDFGGNHCSPGGNGCSGIASAASCPLVALESLALCDSFCGTYFTECLLNEDSTSATCTCSDGFLGDDCSTYPVYANVAADDTTSTDPDTLVGEGGGEDDLTVVWIIVGVVVGFILIGIIVAAVLKKRQSNSAQSTHTRHISTNVPMTSVAAAAAPVKSNWEKHMDPASGQPYWFNTVTQESSWEYRN
jgi:hypothetical protein